MSDTTGWRLISPTIICIPPRSDDKEPGADGAIDFGEVKAMRYF
jgi:hypothetical protein